MIQTCVKHSLQEQQHNQSEEHARWMETGILAAEQPCSDGGRHSFNDSILQHGITYVKQ